MDSTHASLLKANQDHFDEEAKKWDDDPEYVKVSRESYSAIMHHLGAVMQRHTSNVLNFGCGTGLLEAQLRFSINSVTGIDISSGMIERMNRKIKEENWANVKAVQIDVLDEAQASLLPIQGFDVITSCYTFHHLHDITAIGKALLKYLKPGGYFCIIDFADRSSAESHGAQHHHNEHDHHQQGEGEQQHMLADKLSEAAKASIGSHDGFSKSFLLDYYQTILDLEEVTIKDATPLKCDGVEYPTIIAYGRRKN